MVGLGQVLGMATSITQSSYCVFIHLADFIAFIESGLSLAIVFAIVGLVADIANRNKPQSG
jgi:hypothetical protein